MAKRRDNNEGSIFQRKNGTWRAQVSLEGRRLSFSAKSKRECQEWIKKTIQQIDKGMTHSNTLITLNEYLESWLASTKVSKRQSTWAHYEQLTQMYVLPYLGQLKIKNLRPDQVQVLYNRLLANDVGDYTIIKIHTMLHSALGHAVKLGLVNRNATDAAIPPKAPIKEMKILNESQISQMLITAQGSRLDALLHIAVATGMRQMELLGLKWIDLDWISQTVKVERQLARSSSGNLEFVTPKTKNGRRTVALGKRTIEVLHSHHEKQFEERKKVSDDWSDFGLIFTTRNGRPIHYRNLLRDFKNVLRKAGLPEIRFHDLRHTAASLMLNHGVPVIVVSRHLGHAKPSITLDIYGHLIPSMQVEAAELIDELITPIEIAPNILEPQRNKLSA